MCTEPTVLAAKIAVVGRVEATTSQGDARNDSAKLGVA